MEEPHAVLGLGGFQHLAQPSNNDDFILNDRGSKEKRSAGKVGRINGDHASHLSSWAHYLFRAAGYSPDKAIWGIPVHQGWQLIHAYCVFENLPRVFSVNVAEDPEDSTAFESFRERSIAKTGEEWDDESVGTLNI